MKFVDYCALHTQKDAAANPGGLLWYYKQIYNSVTKKHLWATNGMDSDKFDPWGNPV